MRASLPVRACAVLLFVVGCAATGAGVAPRIASNGGTVVEGPLPPPEGARRLPSSIVCEPEPPCPDCVTARGDEARLIGSLDKEVIRGVIRSQTANVKACYDAIWSSHPDARGKMMVRFGIAPSGAVETSCLVSSELNDAAADRCVVDLALAWRFPKPDGGGWVVVSYPFVFTR